MSSDGIAAFLNKGLSRADSVGGGRGRVMISQLGDALVAMNPNWRDVFDVGTAKVVTILSDAGIQFSHHDGDQFILLPPAEAARKVAPAVSVDEMFCYCVRISTRGGGACGGDLGNTLSKRWSSWKTATGHGSVAAFAKACPGASVQHIPGREIEIRLNAKGKVMAAKAAAEIAARTNAGAAPAAAAAAAPSAPVRAAVPARAAIPSIPVYSRPAAAAGAAAPAAAPAAAAPITLYNTAAHATPLFTRALAAVAAGEAVALDCEGVDLGRRKGSLTLVQLGFADGHVALVDVQGEPALFHALRPLLECDKTPKVVHDCRMDAKALLDDAGIALRGVFDTQVAFEVLEPGTRPCTTGLHTVLDRFAPRRAEAAGAAALKERMREAMQREPNLWAKRPLTADMRRYAADDVASLLLVRRAARSSAGWPASRDRFKALCRVRADPTAAAIGAATEALAGAPRRGWLTFGEDGTAVREPLDEAEAKEADDPHGLSMARLLQAEAAVDWAGDADGGEELQRLLELFPPHFTEHVLEQLKSGDVLMDLVMDLGRPPRARVACENGRRAWICMGAEHAASEEDIACVTDCIHLSNKNRAGIDGTLHRVSVIRNGPSAPVIGITARVGRWFRTAGKLAADLATGRRSVLAVGRPGAGKTTMLRDMARVKAAAGVSVMIVDTSNEIGGDGVTPHRSVGLARRLPVPDVREQHRVMVEAVQNHTPDCVIVDEIGTSSEASQARSISQRGIQLLATAHGQTLADLVHSNDMHELAGGKNTVIQSSMLARQLGEAQTKTERRGRSPFPVCVEMESTSRWVVHHSTDRAVDAILAGRAYEVEVRELVKGADGKLRVRYSIEERRPESAQ